ncbi:MAG: uroporphyrinogen-III C-methyltransferase [Lentisphaeria bacterium]
MIKTTNIELPIDPAVDAEPALAALSACLADIDIVAAAADPGTAHLTQLKAVPAGWDWFTADATETVISFPRNDNVWSRIRSLFVKAVAFVGAGPGHADYCTVMGIKALQDCDLCYYDALASPRLLEHLPPTAQAIYVGKRGGAYSVERDALEMMMVEACREGQRVVRLKGGDPGVFGRLTQELQALEKWGLPYRVVPGVSSMTMATTGTGMLLTSRGISRGFSVTTPRLASGDAGIPGADELRQSPILFFMAVGKTHSIAAELIADGRAAEEPATMVFGAGTANESSIHGTLATIGDLVENQSRGRPGLLVVGPLANRANLYCRDGALGGQHVLLLRPAGDALNRAVVATHDLGGVPVEWRTGEEMPRFDLVLLDDAEFANHFIAAHGTDALAMAPVFSTFAADSLLPTLESTVLQQPTDAAVQAIAAHLVQESICSNS